jgi:predicted Zn-dependent protease
MEERPRRITLPPRYFFTSAASLVCLLLLSCSIANIPVIVDNPIEQLVRDEAGRIVSVTEDAGRFDQYRILLSDFPRRDILGMSTGNRRIYISYALAKLAAKNTGYMWLLRQTLAHEIAHELMGHAKEKQVTLNSPASGRGVSGSDIGLPWMVRYRNYSAEIELQADLTGMNYWAKLHWDCRIWVRILKGFQKQNYSGDTLHPTEERLKQALSGCPATANQEPRPPEAGVGPA